MSLSDKVILPSTWDDVAGTGKSMNELGDDWAIRAYGIKKTDNSFAFTDDTDPRGKLGSIEKASIDQPDRVFFLGGRFVDEGDLGEVDPFVFTRSVVVPDDAVVVTPLINVIGPDATLTPPLSFATEAEIRSEVATLLDSPILFAATVNVDGTNVTTIDPVTSERNTGYRRESPDGGFSYRLPEDNIQDGLSVDENGEPVDVQAQVVPIAISDGYWYAYDTSGLAEGVSHIFNFNAGVFLDLDGDGNPDDLSAPPDGEPDPLFSLNVTYNFLNSIEGDNNGNLLTGTKTDDYIDGGNGNDILLGKGGEDVIVGGNGNDIIDGGKRIGGYTSDFDLDDELWGGNGSDTFIYAEGYGRDVIFDYQLAVDVIAVSDLADQFSQLDIVNDPDIFAPRGITEVAKISFIGGDPNDFILLPNVDANSLAADNFIFG